jgi:hypothetical protein
MRWNKQKPEPKPELSYTPLFKDDFLKRNELFPKLERLIKQAESHYDSGDKELCYEILDLIWRTVDKSKEKPVLKYDLSKESEGNYSVTVKAND